MINEVKIKIDEQTSNYIERLFYEYNASLNILRFLMSQDDIKEETLNNYIKSSEEKNIVLELAKQEADKQYKPAFIQKPYSYTFLFNEYSILYSYEKE